MISINLELTFFSRVTFATDFGKGTVPVPSQVAAYGAGTGTSTRSKVPIYPVNRLSEWNTKNFRQWIIDTSSSQRIGYSGLYSLQNGLLSNSDIHMAIPIVVIQNILN